MVFQSTANGSGRKAKVFCNIIDRNIFFPCHVCKSKLADVKIRILNIILQSVTI
jgi:hypothetical protein